MSAQLNRSTADGREKKSCDTAKDFAQPQANNYISELRDIRNKVRGRMDNADFSNPEEVALIKATARMWSIRLPHAL